MCRIFYQFWTREIGKKEYQDAEKIKKKKKKKITNFIYLLLIAYLSLVIISGL